MAREQAGHRRNLSDTNPSFQPESEYGTSDQHDPHSSQRNLAHAGWGRGSRHQPPQYIDEEEEYGSDTCDATTLHDGGFELVGATPGPSQQRRTRSPARYSRHANPRRPEIQKFRTKVHAPDDTRYIMIGPEIEFGEFEKRVREKFGFRCPLKMKVQDDGDMITMVDQEDLDLLVSSAKEVARREGSEMGKIEVSLSALYESLKHAYPDWFHRLDMGRRALNDLMHDWNFFSVDISIVILSIPFFYVFSMKIRPMHER